jgi:DHA1 family bicyclomycin/chloramphenicol resistance-like MFS transporter
VGTTLILAGLAMLGPFSINTYLPSFGEMAHVFAVDVAAIQQTVAIYFAAFAFMSLWHGSLSDALGRRRVVLVGLAVYALASLACVFATRVEELWVLRAFQGFSAGAGIVIGRAVVRDLHDGPLAQRMMSHVVMMFGLAPAISPLIGGWLQAAFGWRSVFLFLCLLASGLLVAVLLRLPETLPISRRQPLRVKSLACGYLAVFGNLRFMTWSLSYASMFGASFIYVLSAPVFLMSHLGLGETDFLWLFGPATAGMVLGSALSGKMTQRWSRGATIRRAFMIMSAAVVLNIAVCLVEPVGAGWYVAYILMFNLGMSLAIPTVTLRGLDCVPDRRGMATSVQLFVQTGFNAIIASVLAPALWDSLISLAYGAAGLLLCATIGVVVASRMSPAD